MKKYNFSAGPSILPQQVFEISSKAILNFQDSDLSILEISHRSPAFVEVMNQAEHYVQQLLNLPDQYKVLFLSGGASTQFFMSAYNLFEEDKKAVYVDTGTWSSKAIKEANHFGNLEVIASSKDSNYNYIPEDYSLPSDTSFLHLTSNNTIFGTQIHKWPTCDAPILCDMSSDIFSRKIPVEKFGLIYAGAQKNMGPAGTTLVIIREDLLGKVSRHIPTMLDYKTHIAKKSSFNTPPVFPIYVSMLTLQWLTELGGIEKIEEINVRKAGKLYDEIDRNPLFKAHVPNPRHRSLMNVTFNAQNEEMEKEFLAFAESRGCVALKGHRSVGGIRASIYNAMPEEGVDALIQAMQEFSPKM